MVKCTLRRNALGQGPEHMASPQGHMSTVGGVVARGASEAAPGLSFR